MSPVASAQATCGFSIKGGSQWPGVVLRGCMVTVLCSKHVVCSQAYADGNQLGVKLSGPLPPGWPCSVVAGPLELSGLKIIVVFELLTVCRMPYGVHCCATGQQACRWAQGCFCGIPLPNTRELEGLMR